MKIIIRGGGDTGSAVSYYLFKAGFRNLIILEREKPTAIRRFVSFASAVYYNEVEVEGIRAKRVNFEDLNKNLDFIPVIIDEKGEILEKYKPDVIIDAVLSKRFFRKYNLNDYFVIGLGPEFIPSKNCHVAIETKRGHNLGRIYYKEKPEKPTGIPGEIAGFTEERILRAPISGVVKHEKDIGDLVKKGQIVCFVNDIPVYSKIDGIIRGLIEEIEVKKGQKIGDVDPRGIKEYCYTISDKSRCIAGSVLLAVLNLILNFHNYSATFLL